MNEIFIAYILGVLTFPVILGLPRLIKLLKKAKTQWIDNLTG